MKTLKQVFADDLEAITITKKQARKEFEKNFNLTNKDEIKECIQLGYDSIEVLKKTVIQAKLNDRGNYGKFL